jgi:hypothetical protein
MDWQRSGLNHGLGCPMRLDARALAVSGPTLCHTYFRGILERLSKPSPGRMVIPWALAGRRSV